MNENSISTKYAFQFIIGFNAYSGRNWYVRLSEIQMGNLNDCWFKWNFKLSISNNNMYKCRFSNIGYHNNKILWNMYCLAYDGCCSTAMLEGFWFYCTCFLFSSHFCRKFVISSPQRYILHSFYTHDIIRKCDGPNVDENLIYV